MQTALDITTLGSGLERCSAPHRLYQYLLDWIEIIGHSPVSEAFMSRAPASFYVFRIGSSVDVRMLGSEII